MSSATCSLPASCEYSSLYSYSPNLHLVAANEDMSVLLAGILDEQGIAYERRHHLCELTGAAEPHRIIALLRHLLSGPERQAVSVLSTDSSQPHPNSHTLDQWWRIHQTAWFGDAMANQSFETWFQSIVDTNQHRIVGHECLIRLSNGRMHNGVEILEAARIRNDIHAFDSCARSLAIRSAARQSKAQPPTPYFINFIPASIYNPDYCLKSAVDAAADSGMDRDNIVFEAVDSDRVEDTAHLRRIRDYCERNGFGFALDNVGIGKTSQQILADLHPDYIKLDRSLTMNIEKPRHAATIGKLAEVAARLGARVIAEGIEKTETMENLWLLGVEWMQGYFFGRPSPQIARLNSNSARSGSPQNGDGGSSCRMLDTDLVNLSQALDEECRTESRFV